MFWLYNLTIKGAPFEVHKPNRISEDAVVAHKPYVHAELIEVNSEGVATFQSSFGTMQFHANQTRCHTCSYFRADDTTVAMPTQQSINGFLLCNVLIWIFQLVKSINMTGGQMSS